MIVHRPIVTPQGFKRFDIIPTDYWACGWIEGEAVARMITSENEYITPPSYPNSPIIMDGIAVETKEGFERFTQAVNNEGITIPPEILDNE